MIYNVLDRSRLSQRESEVLDLATLGMTDQQIAQQLHLALSTVNSYWVRIRGKLGHFSRTELVASVLKSEAGERIASIQKQSDEFERLASERESYRIEGEQNGFFRAALEAIPEAFFIAAEDGRLVYANSRLEGLLGYDPGELNGRDLSILFAPSREFGTPTLKSLLGDLENASVGIDTVLYANRKSGPPLRIILLLGTSMVPSGIVTSGLVRTFMDEVDARRVNVSQPAPFL